MSYPEAMSENKTLFYATWATAWGPMGGVWGPKGLARIVLPHYMMKDLEQLLAWEHQGAQRDEKPFASLIELCRAYFNGKPADFSAVECDMPAAGALGAKVLGACRQIAYGQTRSYLQLATLIGSPDAARAVAAALGRNTIPLVIPCHRVTYADGRSGGFSAPGGVQLKDRMLAMESKFKVG